MTSVHPGIAARLAYGDSVRGRVYLHQEQGVGDALMLLRYVPMLRPLVDALTVEVIAGLAPLVREMLGGHEGTRDVAVVAKGAAPVASAFDYQLPMFSLPAIFGTTLATVPNPIAWWPKGNDGDRIVPESGRIGLCWAGSASHPNDLTRSMPFAATFPLLDLATSHGLTFQSLQFGYDVSPPLEPCPAGDFLETARAIAGCETVVSVDTSVAHLAGAMGVRTFVLLPFVAEWRWLQDRDDSPWYPSIRLWRQARAGDWGEVVDRVVNELSKASRDDSRRVDSTLFADSAGASHG